ncbi:hypothetical protein [Psychromicrobium xiongbiense]|uniref:hypothetical protein n=1 Tax=Psychromicrobium xiongbiense TaxID=3051184 RepID=UPI002554A762|nr:hypothetical protein [Psychromicrobium sp. YIM S02556]
MNRIVSVAKMQLLNKWTFLGIPAVMLTLCFALSLAIFGLIPNSEGFKPSGAGQAPLWYFFGLGIQALTLTFPFSQGMSVSRRSYFLGTMALFSALSLIMALLYWGLGLVESATNGWGLQGHMFSFPWVSDGPWFAVVLFFFAATMFLFLLGFWCATIYKRWHMTGLLILLIGFAVIILALVAVLVWQNWWLAFYSWFAPLTNLSVAALALGLCVVLAVTSYLTLRRATP